MAGHDPQTFDGPTCFQNKAGTPASSSSIYNLFGGPAGDRTRWIDLIRYRSITHAQGGP